MAATSPSCSPKLQKQQLLDMGLGTLESWSADVLLEEFEGVTVNAEGFIVKLDLSGKGELLGEAVVKLCDIAQLETLQELNLSNSGAQGMCLVVRCSTEVEDGRCTTHTHTLALRLQGTSRAWRP